MNVFDSSALLAYVQGEPGEAVVRARLEEGGVCSVANWSEIAQKVRAAQGDWDLVRGLLLSYDLQLEPVTVTDAESAAEMWRAGEGLSLADRLCLAVGARLGATVVSCDTAWRDRNAVEQVR